MAGDSRIGFDRLLCPLDFTEGSDEGLRYAIALARAFGAELLVCHAVESNKAWSKSSHGKIRARIKTAVKKYLIPDDGITLSWEIVIAEGRAGAAIAREAANRRVDLIVLRSRRRPVAAMLLGSTAELLCRNAPCPVLVTHAGEREWAGSFTNQIDLRRVLVAYDFSSDAELALSYAMSLSQGFQAELHLVHVLRPRRALDPPEIAFLPVTGEGESEAVLKRLRIAVSPSTYPLRHMKVSVREGYAYRELLAYAEENACDLICIGASGAGFGMRALFGSNADRVLRQAGCPVLIARPLKPAVLERRPSNTGPATDVLSNGRSGTGD